MSRVPHNPEAEEKLIEACLLDPFAFDAINESEIKATDFYSPQRRTLFSAMLSLRRNRVEVSDRTTIITELTQRGTLETVSVEYIDKLFAAPVANVDMPYLIRSITGCSVMRAVIMQAQTAATAAAAWDGESDPYSIAAKSGDGLVKLSQRRKIDKTERIGDVAAMVLADIDAILGGQPAQGFGTWLPAFNDLLDLVEPRELVVIGGRPAQGKTQFGIQWIRYLAEVLGIPCSIASLEMDKKILTRRLMGQMSSISSRKLRIAELSDFQRRHLGIIKKEMDGWPIYIDSEVKKDVDAILAWMDFTRREYGARVFMVDYLQIMGDNEGEQSQTRASMLARMAEALREFSFQHGVNVIVLSQVKRDVERRDDKLPMMSDLMESGGIEAAAKKVITIMRPSYYDEKMSRPGGGEVDEVWLRVAKNSEGATGKVKIGWNTERNEFVNSAANVNADGSTGF